MPDNKPLTGYPSIDKPWLKYYSEEAINAPLPECTMYEYIWKNNKDIAVFFQSGAYCYEEGMHGFLRHPLPNVMFLENAHEE